MRACIGCGRQAGTGDAGPDAQAAQLARLVEYNRIIESFDVLSVPAEIQALIREALDSPKWDWFKNCDGCTAVSEVYWPTKYFPPCLRHDFDWFTGNGGWASNVRFYRIQRAYGMDPVRSGIRFAGVTLAWYTAFKWRDLFFGCPGQSTAK